jgi:hypothetical protein
MTDRVGSRKTLKRVGCNLTIKHFFMKKYLFGLLAVVFAIGAVAFTPASHKTDIKNAKFATQVFSFLGASGTEYDPTKYGVLVGNPATLCPATQAPLCAIIVTTPAEVYPAGTIPSTWVGKPRVDANATGSTINSDLVGAQVSPGIFNKVNNRIFVKL